MIPDLPWHFFFSFFMRLKLSPAPPRGSSSCNSPGTRRGPCPRPLARPELCRAAASARSRVSDIRKLSQVLQPGCRKGHEEITDFMDNYFLSINCPYLEQQITRALLSPFLAQEPCFLHLLKYVFCPSVANLKQLLGLSPLYGAMLLYVGENLLLLL